MAGTAAEHRNEIVLVGRVTTVPHDRELPSGDVITSWRVTVDRAGAAGGIDVVDCSAWTARARRAAARWEKGDVVQVTGALRRRFWRAGSGVASACDVDVATAKRLASVATPRRTRGAVH
jgi:single-strand DNA-binding protein